MQLRSKRHQVLETPTLIVVCGALNFSVIPTNIYRNISTDSDANQISQHVPVSDKVENSGRDKNRAFVKPDLPQLNWYPLLFHFTGRYR